MKPAQLSNEPSSTTSYGDFRLWLQSEFARRCKKNSAYSLRSFAQLLDMDSSTLSQVLSGKRKVSDTIKLRICDVLKPSPHQRDQILRADVHYQQVSLDAFAVISDWYHYAILELTFAKDFRSDPAWISRSLGITVTETKLAIERLKRLELLDEDARGNLKKTEVFITNFDEGITAPALKELQRQILKKALDAIDNTPQSEKDITSMTMAIDESNLPKARKIIKKFRRDLCQFLENGKQTRVYNLGIQLYPVSKSLKK